ncbi:hypothetical protein [Terrabacter terrigena]|uniref:HK97 gp10 family phage protein n=1 Tax=Terrabacter terrigena TaxID=574718 RepID=A0ABW3MXW9_9MICO
MSDFEVTGADQLKRLAKALGEVDDVRFRKELHKGLRDAVTRQKPVVAQGLEKALPARLRARGAAVKQSVSVNASHDPGVTVAIRYGNAGRGIGAVNAKLINQQGILRHRVFGSNQWVDQRVGGQGWFDKGWQNAAPAVRAEIEKVVERLEDEIVQKARAR